MKQLYLFAPSTLEQKPEPLLHEVSYWKLYIDGAARNNPGPAGAGIYLVKNDTVVEQLGFYLGKKTNNQAEYLALVLGAYYLKKHVPLGDLVLILSDSQLLVRQNKGIYKVKHPELQPLHRFAQHTLRGINHDFEHIPREDNEQADALANEGIDKKNHVPADIADWLHKHEISL